MRREILCLFGYPCSGKSPIIAMLKLSGYHAIGVGKLCREHIREGTSFGRAISPLVAGGHLASDDLISKMVMSELNPENDKIALDGFPRNISQSRTILDYSLENGYVLRGIHLDIPLDSAIFFMKIRRLFKYRNDGRDECLRTRIAAYERETLPCLEFLKNNGANVDKITIPFHISKSSSELFNMNILSTCRPAR